MSSAAWRRLIPAALMSMLGAPKISVAVLTISPRQERSDKSAAIVATDSAEAN